MNSPDEAYDSMTICLSEPIRFCHMKQTEFVYSQISVQTVNVTHFPH